MKAKELAKKLLEHPEYSVQVEFNGRYISLYKSEVLVNDFNKVIYLGY